MLRTIASAPSRTQQVYEAIRERICDCTLKPGTHLVQEELAETLGVSRQPIQQAMLLLKADGLVIERGARGLYVSPLDPETVEHWYQIRLALDVLAARLVAERVSESADFAKALRRQGQKILVEGMRTLESGSALASVRLDVEFHNLIYRMSGNPLIETTADPSWHMLRRMMVAVLLHANRGERVWREHREILDALAAGREDAAVSLVTQHVRGAQDALVAALLRAKADEASAVSNTAEFGGSRAVAE